MKTVRCKARKTKKEAKDVAEELNLDDLDQVSGGTMRGQVVFTPRTELDSSNGTKQN